METVLISRMTISFSKKILHSGVSKKTSHFSSEEGGSMFFRNVGIRLEDHTMSHPEDHNLKKNTIRFQRKVRPIASQSADWVLCNVNVMKQPVLRRHRPWRHVHIWP
jgi:hypothetical protein